MDDVGYYNRVREMMHMLSTNNNSDNDDVEGFCYRWDSKDNYTTQDLAHLPGIPSGLPANVCRQPLLGLFNQSRLIPLMRCPLTLEFEIVSGAT